MKWLSFLGLLLLAGCGTATPVVTPSPLVAGYPMTVTDGLGRKVTIANQPRRVVSINHAMTEVLFAIGAGHRVVAVTTIDTYPPDVTKLPNVGGFTSKMLNLEAVLGHKPDLVIATGGVQEPVIESLTKLGITVYAQDPKSFDEIVTMIQDTGRITGCEAKANEVATDFRNRFNAVKERTAKIAEKDKPKVLYILTDEPLMTVGPTTFIGQMITLAGGVSVFADVTQPYPQINDEAVLLRPADIILAPDHGTTGLADRLPRRPGWDKLTAIQHKRIYMLNEDHVSRAGPRLIDGLEAIEKVLRAGQ